MINKQKDKKLKKKSINQKSFTLNQLVGYVDSLSKQSKNSDSIKNVFDTASKKWESSKGYEFR